MVNPRMRNEIRTPMGFLRHVGGPLAVALIAACSSTPEKAATGEAKTPEGPRELEHQDCKESMGRLEALDTHHDGKPELKQVLDKSGREICRISDLNHDGK